MDLPVALYNLLKRNNIHELSDITSQPKSYFEKIDGLSPKKMVDLENALQEWQAEFAPEPGEGELS